MNANFRLKALPDSDFHELFKLSDSELEKIGAKRMIVDQFPGFPCRISLQDAEIGEEVILLSHFHHDTKSPYRASGPIFIRKTAKTASLYLNEVPKMFHHRLLSLRSYDKNGMMIRADVVEGTLLKNRLTKIFENREISYIHIHNAKAGCYNCLVEREDESIINK